MGRRQNRRGTVNDMEQTGYRHLAYVYDDLMYDFPYHVWLDWVTHVWQRAGLCPQTIVDLACGTGTITSLLVATERTVIGIDRSADMLAVAQNKSQHTSGSMKWLQQDMRELLLPQQVDAVVCFCDSLNYLLSVSDWQRTFQSVYQALKTGGLFLFDVHTEYKIQSVLGNNVFAWEEPDIYCVWHNALDEACCLIEEDLTLFVTQPDGSYERFDETHRQRTFPPATIQSWLEAAGFTVLNITGDPETERPPRPTDERLFFSVQKCTS